MTAALVSFDPQGGDGAIDVWNRVLALSWIVWVALLGLDAKRR